MSDEVKILVIGKSGNGRSTLCNALLGENVFPVGRGMVTTTRTAREETAVRGPRRIKVVDTPDITNCGMTAEQKQEEVAKWRRMTLSRPDVVILTVRCDVRYTAEEYAIYKEINSLWGDNYLKEKLIVAFTFADLQDNPLEEELKTVCSELRSVLREAEGMWVSFDKTSEQNRSGVVYKVLEAAETKEKRLEEAKRRGDDRPTGRPGSSGPRPKICLVILVILVFLAASGCIVLLVLRENNWAIGCGVVGLLLIIALLFFYKQGQLDRL